MKTRRIILASESKRRKLILKELGLKFLVIPAGIKENTGSRFSAVKLKKVALRKAEFVAKKAGDGIIIAADTVVVVKGRVYGKPGTKKNALKMLKEISGTYQHVWTAVAIVDTQSGKRSVKTARSVIKMKVLGDADIKYLANKNLDKAGGYGIQEDDRYLKVISGSYTNIVGFPVELFKKMARGFRIRVKK